MKRIEVIDGDEVAEVLSEGASHRVSGGRFVIEGEDEEGMWRSVVSKWQLRDAAEQICDPEGWFVWSVVVKEWRLPALDDVDEKQVGTFEVRLREDTFWNRLGEERFNRAHVAILTVCAFVVVLCLL